MSLVGKWMELEIIVLSEISQFHKDKYCMFSLICGNYGESKTKNQGQENKSRPLGRLKGKGKGERGGR
jgi:hypothetical protein